MQSGRIVKLECGQSSSDDELKCALKKFESKQFNNLNVRKFFKEKLTASNCNNGYYQLLVKSMHKKVLKGT